MRFKQYLQELAEMPIEAQDEPEALDSIKPSVLASINNRLDVELDGIVISPQIGVQKVRKVLHTYGLDMPVLYGADSEGDEIIIELQTGVNLYIIYAQTDDGQYEFHSEVVNDEDLEEILKDEEDTEE
jgi:hypothetical protein